MELCTEAYFVLLIASCVEYKGRYWLLLKQYALISNFEPPFHLNIAGKSKQIPQILALRRYKCCVKALAKYLLSLSEGNQFIFGHSGDWL